MRIFIDTKGNQDIARAFILIAYEKLASKLPRHFGFATPRNIYQVKNNQDIFDQYISLKIEETTLDIKHGKMLVSFEEFNQVSLAQAITLIEEEEKRITKEQPVMIPLSNTIAQVKDDQIIIDKNTFLTKGDLKKLKDLAPQFFS